MQILLDEDRYRRLQTRATREGVSVGAYIREAIDRRLGGEDNPARDAARSFLAAPRLPVGEPDELARELEDIHDRDGSGAA